jgi:hypothetical protein
LSTNSKKGDNKTAAEEKEVLQTIEDLRSEVRELRSMVNMLVEMLVSLETNEDMDLDMDPNMMSYDPLLKSGRYCM